MSSSFGGVEPSLRSGPRSPPTPSNLAVPIFARGSFEVDLYAPIGNDPQQPHDRGEA